MKIFEVEFLNSAIPNRIIFAEKRLDIWRKFPGIVRCIHAIIIT